MVLKRKRSDSEISTTSSILSSPPLSSNLMSLDSFNGCRQIQTPSLFSSRTRKRHRDNRPDENTVHRMPLFLPIASGLKLTEAEHTLSLLFSASQREKDAAQAQSQSSIFSSQDPVSSLPPSNQSSGQQSSLHSFWTIPSARSSSPSSNSSVSSRNTPTYTLQPSYFQPTNCEDCDSFLDSGDGDVDMMDVDSSISGEAANHACFTCGKVVCHSCAVSNLGAERKCLLCAGENRGKKWEGGGVLPTMFRRVAHYE